MTNEDIDQKSPLNDVAEIATVSENNTVAGTEQVILNYDIIGGGNNESEEKDEIEEKTLLQDIISLVGLSKVYAKSQSNGDWKTFSQFRQKLVEEHGEDAVYNAVMQNWDEVYHNLTRS